MYSLIGESTDTIKDTILGLDLVFQIRELTKYENSIKVTTTYVRFEGVFVPLIL